MSDRLLPTPAQVDRILALRALPPGRHRMNLRAYAMNLSQEQAAAYIEAMEAPL